MAAATYHCNIINPFKYYESEHKRYKNNYQTTNNSQNYLDLQSGRYPVLLGVLFTNKLTNINEKMINYWRHNFFYLVHILPLF